MVTLEIDYRSLSHSSTNLNNLLLRHEDNQISHNSGQERASYHFTRKGASLQSSLSLTPLHVHCDCLQVEYHQFLSNDSLCCRHHSSLLHVRCDAAKFVHTQEQLNSLAPIVFCHSNTYSAIPDCGAVTILQVKT